jgi:hypothetical protein
MENIQSESGETAHILGGEGMGYCEEKKLYVHVSNSEWWPMTELFQSPEITKLDFCWWGLQNKGGCTT